MTNTKHRQGTVSQLLAASYLVENGYIVSEPINDFNEYDLVIDNGKLNRVQVKTIYWDNSKKRYLISLVTSHIRGGGRKPNKKYTNNSFDLLVGIEKETGAIYQIPIKEVVGRRSITLYPKEKPTPVNSRYQEFERYRLR